MMMSDQRATSSSQVEQKARLRKELRRRRRDLSEAQQREAALGLVERGLALLPGAEEFECVAAYWPMRNELDPRPLMEALLARGHALALPVIVTTPGALRFRSWAPETALCPGPFSTQEPHPDSPLVEPDLLLVPLLAMDRKGGRLGYGAGHYDRTLQELRSRKRLLAVGIGYDFQCIEEVPQEPTDQPLDGILTPEEGMLVGLGFEG